MSTYIEERREQGFTLIELLIAIVVVGILAAVAIVGIAGLTNTGSKSACTQSADSAKAASAAYYANNANTWPTTITAMTTDHSPPGINNHPPVYEAPAGASFNAGGTVMTVGSWTLTIGADATGAATFTCGP